MSRLKLAAAVGLGVLAADYIEGPNTRGGWKIDAFGLFSDRALSVVANPEYQTFQGQTQIYRKTNGTRSVADDEWCLDHVEIEGQTIPFDLNSGDSLQVESDGAGNQVFRIGVRYQGKRFYALVTIPNTDRNGDGIPDQHITEAGAYTESTTFYEQVQNHIHQIPGTDVIDIAGRRVRLP
ncbi:hypothetical protein GW756_03340 [bacterium]|nr:hypothetical protein [bacterium]NCQ55448.1 hypothetical protein [Candidatus Parcubacteria bacterium]NCS67810.1 hypothetical protein [Candidatus Peregrinibacteria bacterium]NCS96376.1 hypothetical protein [bacterium]